MEIQSFYFQNKFENFIYFPIPNFMEMLTFNNFKTTTAQTPALELSQSLFENLIETAWMRAQRPVRLIGLGIQFDDSETAQLKLPI